MSTSRVQIEATAHAQGWAVDERFTGGHQLVLRRGERFVELTFGQDGGVSEARTDRRVFDVDKRGNVLRYLVQGT